MSERASGRRRATRALIAAAVVLLVVVVVPAVLGDFSLQLTALILPFTILALSLDLLWGENRLISFGHGAFFAGGGYVGGLILIGHPYDVVSGATSFLEDTKAQPPLDRALDTLHGMAIAGVPIPALVLPPLVTGLAGLLVGVIVFRVPAPEVYLPLVTLGIGVVAGIGFNEIEALGASNGLGGVPSFAQELTGSDAPSASYLFNLAFVALAYGGYWWFRRSSFGWTWRALGDDPVRLEALGYPVRRMRAYGFAASTALAGLAGALYASASGFMSPSVAGVAFSAQALIWVAVGGVGTLLGPLVGTLVVKWGEQLLSSDLGLQDTWQLFLGLLLILIVLVAPGGLMGLGRGDTRAARLLGPLRAARSRPAEGDGEGEGGDGVAADPAPVAVGRPDGTPEETLERSGAARP